MSTLDDPEQNWDIVDTSDPEEKAELESWKRVTHVEQASDVHLLSQLSIDSTGNKARAPSILHLNSPLSPTSSGVNSPASHSIINGVAQDTDVIQKVPLDDMQDDPFLDHPVVSDIGTDNHPALDDTLEQDPTVDDAPHTSRYGLRTRTNIQMNPYKLEMLRYKQTLKSNPDAIIRYKSPDRTRRQDHVLGHEESYEESQQIDVENPVRPRHNASRVDDSPNPPARRSAITMMLDNDEDSDSSGVSAHRHISSLVDKRRETSTPASPRLLILFDLPEASTSQTTLEEQSTAKFSRATRRQQSASPGSEAYQVPEFAILDDKSPGRRHSVSRSHHTHEPRIPSPEPPSDDSSVVRISQVNGASPTALPSPFRTTENDTSSEEEDSAPLRSSREDREAKKRRRQMKALAHMGPAIWRKAVVEREQDRRPNKRTRPPSLSSSPQVNAGQSKVRQFGQAAAIVVDSDSASESPNRLSKFIDLDEESDDSVDVAEIQQWTDEPAKRKNPRNQDAERATEVDLIDRMLSRTTRIGSNGPRDKKSSKRGRLRQQRLVRNGHTTFISAPTRVDDDTFEAEDRGNMDAYATLESPLQRRHRKRIRHKNDASDSAHNVTYQDFQESDGFLDETIGESNAHRQPPNSKEDRRKSNGRQQYHGPLYQTTMDDWSMQTSVYQLDGDASVPEAPSGPFQAANLKVACNIHPLHGAISFSAETYIGAGYLQDLLALAQQPTQIPETFQFYGFGLLLTPASSPTEIMSTLEVVTERLIGWMDNGNGITSSHEANCRTLIRFINLWISRLRLCEPQEQNSASKATEAQCSILAAKLESLLTGSPQHYAALHVAWFTIEVQVRLLALQDPSFSGTRLGSIKRDLRHLLQLLFQHGLLKTGRFAQTISSTTIQADAAIEINLQYWICIIHLLQDVLPRLTDGNINMDVLWQSLREHIVSEMHSTDLVKSERTWESVFCLCSFSQFSVSGVLHATPTLTSSWAVVADALKFVKLTANSEADKASPPVFIKKRDQYVRLITSRCLLLCSRWKWSLRTGASIISSLADIFRSRNFGNLIGEGSDFPLFLRESNFQNRSVWERADTTFTCLLKLIMKYANDLQEAHDTKGYDGKISKLLSSVVPVASVSLSHKPSSHTAEISRLYNRYTAALVGVILQPNAAAVASRIQQSRRYIVFKDAHMDSRSATVRALMHFGFVLRGWMLQLKEFFDWMEEILRVLLAELAANTNDVPASGNPKFIISQTKICSQMLLGSARRVLEWKPQERETDRSVNHYPDVRFLNIAILCMTGIPKQMHAEDSRTADEIRRLVQSFLDQRARAVPAKNALPDNHVNNSESQEDYDSFNLDMHDPALIAALDGTTDSDSKSLYDDVVVAKWMDKTIVPFMYARVCKHLQDENSNLHDVTKPSSYDFAWIDCWADCANVVVAHDLKSWGSFLELGTQSWSRVGDRYWRRRIGLRFLYRILVADPGAYSNFQQTFQLMFLTCLVTPSASMEHEYVHRLLTVDRMQTNLIAELSFPKDEVGNPVMMSPTVFMDCRLPSLRALYESFKRQITVIAASSSERMDIVNCMTLWTNHIITEMEEHLDQTTSSFVDYAPFCAQVVKVIETYRHLLNHGERIGDAACKLTTKLTQVI